jgi:hypothetical protein
MICGTVVSLNFASQWAEGVFADAFHGLFGEQGAAGGADPVPLASAQLHPEEVP